VDWTKLLPLVWEFVNSPTGITLLAGLLLWVLNRIYTKKPAWKTFEGLIVAGCKHAEKAIPDGTENKGMRRFDEALKFILKIHEKAQGKRASASLTESIKEGISLVHNKLEKDETL
jgi:hypothetical protein